MKRYLCYMLATIILGHLAIAALLSYRYWVARDLSDADIRISQLTIYQEQKIAALPQGAIDTVFLGDSSLGNALNAKLFDMLAGTRSVNLALTGSHGHAGAMVLLQKLVKQQPNLKNVVLFFSVDAIAYGQNLDSRFFMSPNPIEPSLPLKANISLVKTYLSKLTEGGDALSYMIKFMNGRALVELPPALYKDDYIIAPGKVAPGSEDVQKYNLPGAVQPKSTSYLREIGVLCKQLNLRCIYVQGPIMAELVHGTNDEKIFFASVENAVNGAGIMLANRTPFLMGTAEHGDSIFHVALASRDAYTKRYAKLLKPLLRK